MKIVYLHQYFNTPKDGGAIRSYYIAKAMVNLGIEVEMITAHNLPAYKKSIEDGINIHYLPIPYKNEYGFLRRIYAFLKFSWLSYRMIRRIQHIDLIYATSTPLTVGLTALWALRRLSIPFYFEVRDLWPEAPIQMRLLKNPLIIHLARKLEQRIYDHASKIIALSPGIKDQILRTANHKNVHIIPNMADCDFFYPVKPNQNSFVITYFGAIGEVNHLEYLIAIAERCEMRKLDIQFLIAGQGARLLSLKKLIAQKELNNVELLGHLDKYEIRDLLNRSQAVYISFKHLPILNTNSPNKFFDALAAGKMIIVNTKGWIKELVEKYHIGFYANPEDADLFIRKIVPYFNNNEKVLKCQQNARHLAESQFSCSILTNQLCHLLPQRKDENPINKESAYILTR